MRLRLCSLVLPLVLAPACLAAQETGVSASSIRFGQSAAFSGPASELGKEMRAGIEAAFNEANLMGGIHGRRVDLVSLDDGYEPGRAIDNTRSLIEKYRVFALIGAVGTPTSRAVAPITVETGIPYIAPFTGAGFLRDAERFPNVVNLRASYHQEVDEMVTRLIEDRGITRIGILYQNDSFGRAGFDGAVTALRKRGLDLVGIGTYPRNTTAVKTAILDLELADPGGVIIVGAYRPAATAIKWARSIGFNPVFVNISFVGSAPLARELLDEGQDVFMTQVMPDYLADDLGVAQDYRQALSDYWPGSATSFNSFEGYVAGRIALSALDSCGENPDRSCFLERFADPTPIDLGGFALDFGAGDNQGSDAVFMSRLEGSDQFLLVSTLNDMPGK